VYIDVIELVLISEHLFVSMCIKEVTEPTHYTISTIINW